MSHIATIQSSTSDPKCRYNGRAFGIWRFYKQPMGLRIRELRAAKGWTQQDLADRANLSRSQLAMIESEARPANTLRLNSIAAALGVSPEELFDSGTGDSQFLGILRKLTDEDRETIYRLAASLAAKR